MKAARILVTLLAVAAAAFLAFRGCQGRNQEVVADSQSPPAEPAAPGAFPKLDVAPSQVKPAAPAKAAGPVVVDADPAPGTPVKDGADVAVTVPYRAGTKSRYRVSEAQLSKDLATDGVQAWQFVWEVSTEVVSGDGSGPARIRFQIDSFEFNTTDPMGRLIKIRSREPDKSLLADPQYGRAMKPMIAILGMPLEFVIGSGGEITAIEGLPAIARTFRDVVDTFSADFRRDVSDVPSKESVTQKWSEILFPPLGGGTLKAGVSRDASFRTTYLERWSNVTAGKLRVTHDDPESFRVEFKGKPEMEELNRPAVGPIAIGVVKARIMSSVDSYVASWRFDRKAGRLLWGGLHAKFRVDVARDANGADTHFTDIERQIVVELLDK